MKCEWLPVISFIKFEFSDRLLFAENICVVHLKLQVDSVFVRSDQVESCCRKDRWIRFVSLHLVYYPFERRALFSSDAGKDQKELWRQTLPRSWRIPLVCSPHVWVVVLNVDFIVTFFDTYGLLTLRTIQKPCNNSLVKIGIQKKIFWRIPSVGFSRVYHVQFRFSSVCHSH